MRLDRFLADHLGSRAEAARAIERGALVDGTTRPKSHRLAGGETVELPPHEVDDEPLDLPPVPIVWQDEHLLIVNKPAGLIVHPGAGHRRGTLVDALDGLLAGGDESRPGIVHRLDRDTSGLLVAARSAEAYRRLSAMVKQRAIERTYLALVKGKPDSRHGRIEAAIGRGRTDPTRISLDTDTPRSATTHFELVRSWPGYSLLEVRLETGRTHQIRVHLAALGLPVVGDPTYGVRDPRLGRQFLHASRLAFAHPFTDEPIEAHAPLPDDLELVLDQL